MDQENLNLTICQVCKKEPAIYGDGISWSRCSKCEYEWRKEHQEEVLNPEPEKKIIGEGMPHQRIKDLVSIIMPVYIINYSLFHYTGNAIGSVRGHTKRLKDGKQQYELVIIDNGSSIKPPNNQSWYADKLIINETNLGVTKAWNQGIRMSFGEYIILLNNDTQVYTGWLETLKQCLDEGGLDLVMATPMYSNTEPFARWVEAEKLRDRWTNKPIQESFSDFKDFSCVMFKKELMDEVGMFDEQFFNYASDSDLFKRMDQLGLKYASTKAVPIHHIIDATGVSIPETPDIMNKDKAKFEEKWRGGVIKMEENITGTIDTNIGKFNSECTICQTHEHQVPEKPQIREDLVRTNETGDKIFLLKDGQTHWVKNPDVLATLGGGFDMVKTLTREEFSKFVKGEDLDMINVERYA